MAQSGGKQVETADHGDQPLARLVLEPRPVVVRLAGEPHIRGRVVAVPQDPRRVVRGAAAVAELELLEPDDGVPAGGQVPRRGRAERTQSDDDVVDVSHARAWAATIAGCRRSVLHRCEPAMGVGARGHAALHRLADRPVLAVDHVPEIARVGRVDAADSTSDAANSR